MPATPEKRQSIRPPRPVLLGLGATVLMMIVVWVVVASAIGQGGQDCPAQRETGAVADRCR